MSLTAQTLARTRCHCTEAELYSDFCRMLATRIIAGNY